MKKNVLFKLLLPAIFVFSNSGNLLSQTTFTESPKNKVNYEQVAAKIVDHALKVKPGESVIITGTPAELDLLGALLVAVSKAGGKPTIQLSLPDAEKKAFVETPLEYLKIPNTFGLMQARAADCFIFTGSTQNPELYGDVSEERVAASRQSFLPLQDAFTMIRNRTVTLGQTGGIPSPAYAKLQGANYEEMLNVFWNAVDVDYNKMLQDGQNIAKMMKPGSSIKIKSDAGTDLNFKLASFPIKINSGSSFANMGETGGAQAWLPAGEVYACVDPKSANGSLVVPSMEFRGKPIKNLKLTFANGKVTDMKADANLEMLKKALEMSTGDKDVLSLFDLGINQNSRILKNSNYYSWEMGGMVTVSIGDNTWAGGNVKAGSGFSFHLPNATATIDGVNIVSNGELKTQK